MLDHIILRRRTQERPEDFLSLRELVSLRSREGHRVGRGRDPIGGGRLCERFAEFPASRYGAGKFGLAAEH